MSGGICEWPGCHEITRSPNDDYCRDHLEELRVIRQETHARAARTTAEHEAQVLEQEEAV